jgi:transposase
MKTNRRDAVSLVKQLRGGDLTAVWVPNPRHEAMRDLTRAREAAVEDLRSSNGSNGSSTPRTIQPD